MFLDSGIITRAYNGKKWHTNIKFVFLWLSVSIAACWYRHIEMGDEKNTSTRPLFVLCLSVNLLTVCCWWWEMERLFLMRCYFVCNYNTRIQFSSSCQLSRLEPTRIWIISMQNYTLLMVQHRIRPRILLARLLISHSFLLLSNLTECVFVSVFSISPFHIGIEWREEKKWHQMNILCSFILQLE